MRLFCAENGYLSYGYHMHMVWISYGNGCYGKGKLKGIAPRMECKRKANEREMAGKWLQERCGRGVGGVWEGCGRLVAGFVAQ